MYKLLAFIAFFIFINNPMSAQENNELPYAEIPEPAEEYSAGAVVSRMIDGLGFRFYWATEGLRPEDLSYRPAEGARTSEETADHILGLSRVILNSALNQVNESSEQPELSFEQKRKLTLENLEQASRIFRSAEDLSGFKVSFKGKNGISEYPMWNQINGPIADALWHCGQLVSFRRASGNPFNSKVSVFMGKLRD